MVSHDAEGDAQTEPRAAPLLLGGKERVEDSRKNVRWNAWSVVIHLDGNPSIRLLPRPKPKLPASPLGAHGLQSVVDEIREGLLHLVEVGQHIGKVRSDLLLHLDVVGVQRGFQQVQRFLQNAVEPHRFSLGVAWPGKTEEVLDYLLTVPGAVHDALEIVAELPFDVLLDQELRKAQYPRERIVQLVSHARHDLSDAGQLLALLQERRGLVLLRDV